MVHLISMQKNFTVCVMKAEFVGYGTFDQYADEVYSMCNEYKVCSMVHLISMQMNFTVCVRKAEFVEYGTFDQYADEVYSMCNEYRACRLWYI